MTVQGEAVERQPERRKSDAAPRHHRAVLGQRAVVGVLVGH
ncbi:MAG: hypothetical protein ACRDS9_13590 [Pseudonocardiaceae bacterium]